MKTLLKLESLSTIFFSFTIFITTRFQWWLYPALFFLPDISMVGYLVNSKAGAFLYNLFHHQGIAILIFVAGYIISAEYLEAAGLILLGHSALDRMLGFGLKYNDSFNHTHLGWIGKKNQYRFRDF
jgi:hypothetical protein